MQYKVIWFDDEYDKPSLQHIPKLAQRAGIELVGFASADEGINELDRAASEYQAVILDGLFYDSADQAGDTMDETALNTVLLYLRGLSSKRKLKAFILSGQPSITENANKVLKVHKIERFYDKTIDGDYDALWRDIKATAQELPDTQIRHRFQRVFEVCTDKYIGETAGTELLNILRRENDEAFIQDAGIHINAIRKILEDLFRACHREQLIPDTFVHGGLALNETGRFLMGSAERGYQLKNEVVPKMIGELIDKILSIAQSAAHRLHVDEHLALVRSPYLLYSTTYMLLDVLLWFKGFADTPHQGPYYERLERNSITAPLYEGPIERDSDGNFHCGEYSIPPGRIKDGFELGSVIAIIGAMDNTSTRNMHLYPKFASKFRKA